MFQALLTLCRERFAQLPDYRKPSPNLQYTIQDAALSAFAVFLMQSPSFLAHQRDMQRRKGRNNANSLFGVHRIPSDNQIRNILDPIAPAQLSELFWQIYGQLDTAQLLKAHTGFAGNLLCALDGVQYFSSQAISCENCTRFQHDETVTYGHSLIAPVLVAPDAPSVFNLEPEFIQPQDGHDKQDCELAAAKRWLKRHAQCLPAERTTILGDDLLCHQPFCEAVRAAQCNFILVCLPESHTTLYTEIALLAQAGLLDTLSQQVWNGRHYETRTYRYTNHVPLRSGADGLLVNWCEVTVTHSQTGEQLYYNSFVTNFALRADTVAEVVRSGRARWKTENENHNTLKNRGYHLEHNFGHGRQFLSMLLVSLNLLAFLLHTVLLLTDHTAQQVRTALGSYVTFWGDLRTLTRYLYFQSWAQLFDFMLTQLELASSP